MLIAGAPAGPALAATPAPAATPATISFDAAVSASVVSQFSYLTVKPVLVTHSHPATRAKHLPVHKPVRKAAHKKAKPQLAFGVRVVRDASVYRGTPYQWGATGPSRFDCSGFTRFIFAKFGISLPHSSAGQYSVVRHVASANKQIGDLVFFHSGSGHVYHVGIYAGGDQIWAATHTGDFVRLEGMWSASYYVGRISR